MVRTMRGQFVDMARLAAENATKIALGNASMNARGDIISHSGTIIKTQEQITREYNASNPKAVRQVALRDIQQEVFVSPSEALAAVTKTDEAKKKRKLVE